ncbi:peptidylprolyl isomerase [Georgenia soli]|uniref:peptidylprolyl isomerase n=1 Tax=Georgenia soli TaxID=638953 RepID=A0A2A9EH62_9MICO|nr:peptidylprolyl isomerase [Georgenia soli]
MRRRPAVLTSLALAAALTLASCSGGEGEESPTDGASASASAEATPPGTELPTVKGAFGEDPTIEFPGSGAPADLKVEVLQKGDGAEVGADDFVVADYVGQVWDGEVFDSSFERGAPTGFSLNGVIQGWKQGLTGTHVGDRVLLSIPSELGYPQGTPDGSVAPGDTLVFVVDVVDAYAPDVAGQADATPVEPAPDLPVVVKGGLGEPASVTVEEGAPEPTEASVTVIATGSGEKVPETPGTSILIQLAENAWDNSQPNSTWESSGVTSLQVGGGGLFDQLIGVPVGSRAVLQAPGTEGGEGEDATPAFAGVVDIIAVLPAPSDG